MKLKEACAHSKEMTFWAEKEGKIIHWCCNCGGIQFEKFSRGAFGTKQYEGLSKRTYPRIAYA